MTQPPQQPPGPAGGPYYGPPPGGAYYGPPPFHPPPPALSPGGAPLADFGSRLLAAIIDGAILTGVAMIVVLPVFLIFFFTRMTDVINSTDPTTGQPDPATVFSGFVLPLILLELGLVAFTLVIYYFYYVEMLFRSGQTVGKKALKIRIVPLNPSATLTRGMAAKRYLVEFGVSVLVPFFQYLDGLWQLWDKPYQQTLHDKFAQTVVIKVFP
ncbi:MAG TPA: RDD family protein [Actinoplanes sp.]|nr:RDD family protein [Actinoplanes sp.]